MSLCGSACKEALNDDVLVLCFGHLEIADVMSANLVSADWRRASEHDSIWEPLCEELCATKTAQYHLTPARKATLEVDVPGLWKHRYKALKVDGRRTYITVGELVSHTFDFTFRFQPSIKSSQNFRFGSNGKISGHPMGLTYNWWLEAGGKQVRLGPFPVAQVYRRDDWGWQVSYQNAVCCSLGDAVLNHADAKRVVSRSVERIEVTRSLPAEIRLVAPSIRTGTSSGSSYGSRKYMVVKPRVTLNEDVLSSCLSFLEIKDVQSAALVAKGWTKAAEDDSVWEPLCERMCATKALKYRLTPAFKALLVLELPGSWKLRFKALCIDGRRSSITKGELMANTFDFTFRFQPNIQTSRSFTFGYNGKVSGHPMGLTYNWWLEDGGKQVRLGPFPVAQVHRREDWGWMVCYQNAVCCSLDNEAPSQKISTTCGQEAAVPHIGSSRSGDQYVRRSQAMMGA